MVKFVIQQNLKKENKERRTTGQTLYLNISL